jgi:peptidoglycan/LPS O-acetylase OafA/YrhL
LTLLFGGLPKKILPGASVTLLPPAWSISLEWQYYLVAPLLAWMICQRSGLLLLGLVGCGGFVYSKVWNDGFLPAKLPLFLVGIGSFHLYLWASRQKKIPNFTFALIAVFVAVMTVCWHWIALGIWTLVLGCLFVGHQDIHDGWTRCLVSLRRTLLCPLLQSLGKISYPLYLVHWPLIIFLLAGLLHWQPHITPAKALLIMLFLGLPLILSTAWLLHKLVEAPMMSWGKKFTR